MRLRGLSIPVILALFFPNPAAAVDYYVNDPVFNASDSWTTAGGSDLNTGLLPSSPKATVNAALALALAGDRIFVDAGTFAETFVIAVSNLTIRGVDSGLTIFDRGDSSAGTNGNGIAASGVSGITLRDFAVRNSYRGCTFVNVDNATVQGVSFRFHGFRGLVLSGGSDGNTIRDGEVRNVSNVGIEVTGSGGNLLSSLRVSGNASRGIALQSNSNANTITACVLESNAAEGLYLIGSHRNVVSGCLARSNALEGFEVDGADHNLFVQNRADSNASYQFRVSGTSTGDTFRKNVIVLPPGDTTLGVRSDAADSLFDFTRNWWGTTDSALIDSRIAGAGADSIVFQPFRLGTVDTTVGADTVAPRDPDTVAVTDTRSTSLTVSWAAVAASEEAEGAVGLAGYRVYRSPTADTSLWVAIATAGAATTSVVDSGLSPNRTFFYRVTALDAATFVNESFFSDSIAGGTTAESEPPDTFLLLSPAQGIETRASTVVFVWTASADDTSPPVTYTLRRSTVANFASFVDSAVGTNTSAALALVGSETVHWRVIAADAVGNTTVAGDSFLVVDTAPPNPFALLVPTETSHETFVRTIQFSWAAATDSHSGLDSYVFQLGTSPSFTGLLFDSRTGLATNTTVTLAAGDTYRWRVIAFDALGNTVVSTDTRTVLVETGTPSAFRTRGPAQNAETAATSIFFSWDTSTDSVTPPVTYVIRHSRVPTFSTFVDSSTGTNTSGILSIAGSDTIFWRVIASDQAGNTTVSNDSSFVLDTTTPALFSLSSPANGANTAATTVTLQWTASSDTHANLNRYQVQVTTFGDFAFLVVDSSAGVSTSLNVTLPQNTYFWRVIAFDDVGNTTPSTDTRSFRIETAPPTSFLLLGPPQGHETTATSILFSWTASTDAANPPVTYVIRRSATAAFTTFTDSAAGTNTSAVVSLAGSDTVFWRVIASDQAGNTTVAGDSQFLVDTAPPLVVVRVRPVAGETSASPVTLDWNATTDSHSGLLRYRLQVSGDSAYASLVRDGFQAAPDSTIAFSNGTYFWRVFAEDDLGNSIASASDTFVVPDTNAPTILSFFTSPDSFVTSAATTTVRGSITDAETPPSVSVRRIGPRTTSDSTLAVGADGLFAGVFALEEDGDSRTTTFVLTAADLGGNTNRDTIGITAVDSVVAGTLDTATGVRSFSVVLGDSFEASAAFRQETSVTVSIVLLPAAGASDSVEVRIDFDDSFVQGAVVVRRPDPALLLTETNAIALNLDSAALLSRYLCEILVFDSAGLPIGSDPSAYDADADARTGVRLVFHYREEDFGPSEANLAVHFFDEASGAWRPVADSAGLSVADLGRSIPNDTVGHVVRHLTIFAPIPTGIGASATLDDVVVFPNPFIPYDGDPSNGEPFSGTPSATNTTGIHIMNLTANVRITIYNALGEKVDEIANLPTQGLAIWDARTSSGEEVSSGVYYIVIRDSRGRTAVRKVAIIR